MFRDGSGCVAERPLVKICGLVRHRDALAAERAGADYLGVVLSAGFRRSVEPARAAALVEGTLAPKVAVLVDESPASAAGAALALGATVLQLHGQEEPGHLEALRARGSWRLWKAVRAGSLDDVRRAVERYVDVADGILVEGREGALGVGGSRLILDPGRVRDLIPPTLDFVLAGGLDPDTVADAARRFGPDVVDVSSGVERAPGVKDHDRVAAFVRETRSAQARGREASTSQESR